MRVGVRVVGRRAGDAAARLAAKAAGGGELPKTSRLGAALLRARGAELPSGEPGKFTKS